MRFATQVLVLLASVATARAQRYVIPVTPVHAQYPGGAGCAVTAFATIARTYGMASRLNDVQLVERLGQIGGTSQEGTPREGQIKMVSALGLRYGTTSDFDARWLDQQIRLNRMVVGSGFHPVLLGYQVMNRKSPNHAILLHGTGDDEFRYLDALPASDRWLSTRKLAAFIEKAPLASGELMVLYPPGR